MTRIRTQHELKTLYPGHFEVLLGYWMSGMSTKEHLDRIVEKVEKKSQQRRESSASPKPQIQQQASLKDRKSSQGRKKELTPNQVFYIRKSREGRKLAGPAAGYYDMVIKRNSRLVFRRYGGETVVCTITKNGGDRFALLVDGQRQVVWKTELQYGYKARSREGVEKAIEIDEEVRKLALAPVLPVSKRYQIPEEDLSACKREGHKLRLVMRGGEVLEGRVEWFGAFDIKVELSTGRSVVVFRHAVYSHEIV